ncbi:MAG: formylglycine-generating enzyme family protein [Anaerolineales bacterium]
MNQKRLVFYISMALIVLLVACVPASTPVVIKTLVTAPPAATETSTAIPPTATSTTAPLDLAGPPMQVGSTYLYFDGALLVAVPGGSFIMGHGGSDNPEHVVTLSDFWIYSTKVTNREFQRCVLVGKCTSPDLQDNQGYNDPMRQSDPVVGVNWAQSEAYCNYANGHLPTEAQWEKVARGPNGNLYPWGNGAPTNDLLNYNNNIGRTTNVVNYPQGKSYYDALDMEGNVYEWVYDWYDPLYYKTSPTQDPQGPDAGIGGQRSVRSTGYKSNGAQVVSSTRFFKLSTDHARDLGFRCVVKDPTFFAPLCQLTALVGSNVGGSSGAASGQTTCPKVSVSVGYAGCGAKAYAVVTFDDSSNPDPNANITGVGGCSANSPGSHYAQYTCLNIPSGGFDVGITSLCNVPVPANVTCPVHYNLVGNSCQWDGSGTAGMACPAGTSYDPINKCCTSTPGTGANFPACPAGTFFQNVGGGVYECLPAQNAGFVIPSTAHVDQPSNACGSNGGNPGGGKCPPPQVWTCYSGGVTQQLCYCR